MYIYIYILITYNEYTEPRSWKHNKVQFYTIFPVILKYIQELGIVMCYCDSRTLETVSELFQVYGQSELRYETMLLHSIDQTIKQLFPK